VDPTASTRPCKQCYIPKLAASQLPRCDGQRAQPDNYIPAKKVSRHAQSTMSATVAPKNAYPLFCSYLRCLERCLCGPCLLLLLAQLLLQ
jgi:hypothetical protein